MAVKTIAINTQLQAHSHHEHAQSPIQRFDRSPDSSRSSPDIKPLSRSTSYSLKHGGPSTTTSRREPLSPHDAPGIHTLDESPALGISMRGKTKARPRGESDLGRPSPIQSVPTGLGLGLAFPPVPESPVTTASLKPITSSSILHEVINGILVPLPFLLASIAYPVQNSSKLPTSLWRRPDHPYSGSLQDEESQRLLLGGASSGPVIQACSLAAATLLLVGALGKIQVSEYKLDRRKKASSNSGRSFPGRFLQAGTIHAILLRILSIALPYYASICLGGLRTSIFLLLVTLSGITNAIQTAQFSSQFGRIYSVAKSRKPTFAVLLVGVLTDLSGLTGSAIAMRTVSGYFALFLSALAVPIPVSVLGSRNILARTDSNPKGYTISTPPPTPRLNSSSSVSSLVSSSEEASITIAAGAGLTICAIISSVLFWPSPAVSSTALAFSTLSLASAAALFLFARPVSSSAKGKPGIASGLVLISLFGFLSQFESRLTPLLYGIVCALGYGAALYDGGSERSNSKAVRHKEHEHKSASHSNLTAYLLSFCSTGSVMDTILRERDSRRIAFFGCLNLGFMVVQLFYGFATGSLGLLTDSIHMLFDCLGLAVGLAAAVMSKWPPSTTFPHGYGKIDTLSGFANGIFLILVSIEIIFDAIHRLNEGHEIHRLNELLLVSTLGLIVNIVGLVAFGHAHHGHDHGHSHPHSHDHVHSAHTHEHPSHDHHDHKHEHDHKYDHDQKHDHAHKHEDEHKHNHGPDHSSCNGHGKLLEIPPSALPSLPPTPFSMPHTPLPPSPAKVGHSHDHGNENMRGIFLHIAADAMGSVAVMISTLMAMRDGWSGWDPIASCIIAIMIFISALPLVQSSGMKLLLALPNDMEYRCRDALQGISDLRGVLGYAGVRLWLQDKTFEEHDQHAHEHQHHEEQDQKILGVMHVIAAYGADMEDVRERTVMYLLGRGMDIVVHVEREGDIRCWCGGGVRTNGSMGGSHSISIAS